MYHTVYNSILFVILPISDQESVVTAASSVATLQFNNQLHVADSMY